MCEQCSKIGCVIKATRSCGKNHQVPHLNTTTGSLQFLEVGDRAKQVVLPQMRFNCYGYVTNWTAHVSIKTQGNYIQLLRHTITFQVWRPDSTNGSYALVGSNMLSFAGKELTDGITRIAGITERAYFSFNQRVEPSDQIHFIPGDVVGWFIIPLEQGIMPSLSVLYVIPSASEQESPGCVTSLFVVNNTNTEPCSVCQGEVGSEVLASVIPLMAPIQGESHVN